MDVLTPIKIGGNGAWQSWCPETGINTFQMVRNFISVFILTSTHVPEGQSMVFLYGLWSSIPFKRGIPWYFSWPSWHPIPQ
jgi:hypothetical protein